MACKYIILYQNDIITYKQTKCHLKTSTIVVLQHPWASRSRQAPPPQKQYPQPWPSKKVYSHIPREKKQCPGRVPTVLPLWAHSYRKQANMIRNRQMTRVRKIIPAKMLFVKPLQGESRARIQVSRIWQLLKAATTTHFLCRVKVSRYTTGCLSGIHFLTYGTFLFQSILLLKF